MFSGRKLLITGGTGSFGNAVLRRFLKTDIAEIRIFSRDEKKQDEMRHQYRDDKLKFYIGDVRDPKSIRDAMEGVDYVFHAAALKQVPSCEFFPMEAVRTNVIGTDNMITAAIQAGVKNVVVLSTDKAAYPINAMGMSKALMEKVTIARSRVAADKGTTLCVTRYGNVMASRGSVIPLFVEQIREGQPLTVTDPNMTRFMMSLDDAVDLVVYAFSHARPGDLFVQKAHAATIGTLAEAVKRVFQGRQPDPGHRHAARREALRDAADARGDGPRDRRGRLLPRPGRRPRPELCEVLFRRAEPPGGARGLPLAQRAAPDVEEMVEVLLKLPYIREELATWPHVVPVAGHDGNGQPSSRRKAGGRGLNIAIGVS